MLSLESLGLFLYELVDFPSAALQAFKAADHLQEFKVSACILALELFSFLVVVSGAFVHEVNALVPVDIVLRAVDDVDLGEVLAVVALGLRQHAALLVVVEPLLQPLSVLVELDLRAFVLVALGKEAHAVASADDPPRLLVLLFLFVIVAPSEELLLQEVLLLFGRQLAKVDVAIFVLVVSVVRLKVLHVPVCTDH